MKLQRKSEFIIGYPTTFHEARVVAQVNFNRAPAPSKLVTVIQNSTGITEFRYEWC